MIIAGKTGSGKSMLMQTHLYDLIRKSNSRRQYAVCVIDPHGDLGRACMSFVNQDKTRLIYLSSAINREANTPQGQDYTCVFNPFMSDGTPEMRYLLTETLTDSLCELLVDANLTVQMLSVIRPCIATILRLHEIGKVPSMGELNRFFLEGQNEDLIALGKTSEVEQHRIFFTHDWYGDNLTISKKSIRVKLSYFLSDPRLANMLNGTSTVNIEQALNDGAVIIVNLPKGSGAFTSKVMGKLLLAYIHALMLRRDTIEPHLRKPCFLVVDEFQTMLTASLASSLAETRKYGLSVILATQSLMQIENAVIRKTIMVNTGIKAVSLTDYQDRVTFARELGSSVTPEDIEKLRPLQFYLKRNDGRHQAFKFDVPILSKAFFLSKKSKKELLDYIVYESGQYRLVPPPAPPLTSSTPVNYIPKEQKKQTKNKPTDSGLKPRF